ncbi:MAG: LysR family transcriptional regulator [Alphaproteobacteria bacterium]|nr:MAG: LysR family transcriptional regulator [Alphaproteobacteria bacterium]
MRKFFDFDNALAVYYVSILGSITKAAEKLSLSQSAVTRQIKMAEGRSGLKLFKREFHHMRPMPEAKPYIDACHEIIHLGNAGLKNSHALRESGVQKLDIKASPSMVSVWIPRYLRGIDKKYPDLHLTLESSIDQVDPQEADVVIRSYVQKSEERLVQHKLFTQYFGLYASQEYVDNNAPVTSIEDLDKHRLIGVREDFENQYPHVNWHMKVGLNGRAERRRSVLDVDSNEGAVNAMRSGLGIISIGIHHMNFLDCGAVRLLPEYKQGPTPVYFVYNKKIENTSNIKKVYEHFAEELEKDKKLYKV